MKNSYYSDYPVQPDNPSDEVRHYLAQYALTDVQRPEDFEYIKKITSPPAEITSIVNPGGLKGYKVGIMGGGLAGMSAAFELRKLGCDITVFDAQERIGGRVYTYYFDNDKKYYTEFGAARVPVTHETSWHYINLFKLHTMPFIQSNENTFSYLRGVRVKNDSDGKNVQKYIYPKYNLTPSEKNMSWSQLINYGLNKNLYYMTPEVRAEIMEVLYNYNRQILEMDYNSIRQVSNAAGLSFDALNLLCNYLVSMATNVFSGFVDYVQEPYSVDFSFLYQLRGGNVNLPLAFHKSLLSENPKEYGSSIPSSCLGRIKWKSSNCITGISLDGMDGKPVLTYKSLKNQCSHVEKFDYVICSIPFSTLRNVNIEPLFSSLKMQAIYEVSYTPAQKTALLCSNRFWEKGGPDEQIFGGISFTDLPASQIFYPSYDINGKSGNYAKNKGSRSNNSSNNYGVLTSYNFNLNSVRLANMPEKERIESLNRDIEKIHGLPLYYMDKVVRDFKTVNWNTEPWFRGGLCFYTPQQRQLYSYTSICPEYNRKVFFAGEHISAKHRWMQGALKSGMEAANQLALSSTLK